jgi:hypothetical protein
VKYSPSRLANSLGLSVASDFYLAGGTALALQLGHRVSVDFDLFIYDDISPSLLSRVQRKHEAFCQTPMLCDVDNFPKKNPAGEAGFFQD